MSKIALVFGGSGGIGQAICSALEKKGITTYSTFHTKTNKVPGHNTFACDVTKDKEIGNIVTLILKKEQKIDIVINAITPKLKLKTIEHLSSEDIKEDIDTILLGGINIARSLIPVMKNNGSGTIINILSSLVLGSVSSRMSSYISAKYGLAGFTKCLALELKSFGISVFGVSPSFVETNLLTAFPAKLIELEKVKRKGGKLILPSEVAEVILDIVENPQKYQTGDNIEVS